jgi:RNA polymerase sigma-70 factor (sigma-E family)
VWRSVVSRGRDAEYTEYVAARLSSLRRLAAVLCDDWQRADDLVQATLIKLYVRWGRVRAASHPDAYARTVLVHEFIQERRSLWVKRVSLSGGVADPPAAVVDQDAVLDLRAAVAALPARQRATLVLRFYCDLNVDQSAEILGCSPGTVKSQTARALEAVRRALGPAPAAGSGGPPAAAEQQIYPGGPGHD